MFWHTFSIDLQIDNKAGRSNAQINQKLAIGHRPGIKLDLLKMNEKQTGLVRWVTVWNPEA